MRIYFCAPIFALLVLFGVAACAPENSHDDAPLATLAQVPGRNYFSLSVHPNGQELLFLELRDDWPGYFRLQRYHLGTRQLQYYQLPADYVYRDAAFSPSGNYIVLRRAPNVPDQDGGWRSAFDRSEIAVMRADGSDFRVLPLAAGLKMGPVMSHDERRIAYWRATQRRPGAKSFAEKFDVWEVDLQTGTDQLFASSWGFFEGGQMQYLKNDTRLVLRTYLPTHGKVPGLTDSNAIEWRNAYQQKYHNSFIYQLQRGADVLPHPLDTGVSYARAPSLDSAQNLYFVGDKPKYAFFRRAEDGSLTQWMYPWGSLDQEESVVAFSDGSCLAFVFYYKNQDVSKKGIALFDVKKQTWTQLSIPNFEEGSSIEIKPGSGP